MNQRNERPCQQHYECSLTVKTVPDETKDAPKQGCPCSVCRSIRFAGRLRREAAKTPSVLASCPGECNKAGVGGSYDNLFSKAYTPAQFEAQPKCENCGTAMVQVGK